MLDHLWLDIDKDELQEMKHVEGGSVARAHIFNLLQMRKYGGNQVYIHFVAWEAALLSDRFQNLPDLLEEGKLVSCSY